MEALEMYAQYEVARASKKYGLIPPERILQVK